MSETIIISNGSKWAGEQPDSIETLLEVMAEHALDRKFEQYGNFAYVDGGQDGETRFFGNFLHVSHVFNIRTTDGKVIEALSRAIDANKLRADYLSQPSPKARRKGNR